VSFRVTAPPPLVKALKAAKRVALVTHVNPDGDGLGSEAALALALKQMGKDVAIVNNDATPSQYGFLNLEAMRPQAEDYFPDLAVALDCPVLERLGERGGAIFKAAPVKAVIDHHVPKEPFGDAVWIAPQTAATGEMIEALLPELGVKLDKAMATALYAALVNDTGCFRHSNTDQHVFASAMRLLEAGADSKDVNRRLLDEKPMRMVTLQAEALSQLKTLAHGKAALVSVSQSQLKAHDATWEDTDGLAEGLRSIEGVEVSAMLREEGQTKAKLSLRSKYAFDVNVFAGQWGGGGHAKAAGATLNMGFAEAIKAVSEGLEKALKA
jgi:phosphoesterase RecJ-like protein